MITKYQQGGNIELQIVNLVLAAMSGDLQATQQINLIMLAAKSGDKRAALLALYILQVALKLQGSRKARLGAKLNYNQEVVCAEDEIPIFMKRGGLICKTCLKLKQGAKKLQKKLRGGWINKDKKIWNWDSMDRFNRIKNYYLGNGELSNEDWGYLRLNPELESALHNLYKNSKLPNKRIAVADDYQRNTHNMPKGADPNARILVVPDSTNNYKGSLGVGQFLMLPTLQLKSKKGLTYLLANNRKLNFHNWQKVARNGHFAAGTFMPYMRRLGFVYNYDYGTWFNPKENLYLYATPEGRVVREIKMELVK